MGVLLNLTVEDNAATLADGKRLTSDRFDPLNFAAKKENLIRSFDLIVITSWNEVLTFNFSGSQGLLHGIKEYLRWRDERRAKNASQVASHGRLRRDRCAAWRARGIFGARASGV